MSRLAEMNIAAKLAADTKPTAPPEPGAAAAASTSSALPASPPSSPSYPALDCPSCQVLKARVGQLEGQLLKKNARKRIVLLSTHGFNDDLLDIGRAQKLSIICFNAKVHTGKKWAEIEADILCLDLSKDADLEFYRLLKPQLGDDVDVVLLCKKSEKISEKQAQSWAFTHKVKQMPQVAESPDDYLLQLIADSLVRVKSPLQKFGRLAKKFLCD